MKALSVFRVDLFIERSPQKWKTICVSVFVRCCFLGAPRRPKVTGFLTRCLYALGKWQRRGPPRGRVYERPHREATGKQMSKRPPVWWRGAPDLLLRVCVLYSPRKHREERWIWGSGRPSEEVLASSWWCLRFNRRTTVVVMDAETHQIIRAGMTFSPCWDESQQVLTSEQKRWFVFSDLPDLFLCSG